MSNSLPSGSRMAHHPPSLDLLHALRAESFEPGHFGVQIVGMNIQMDARRARFQALHEQHQVVPAEEGAVITGLTKSISLDGRAFVIACGQIDIGNAATDMTQRISRGTLQAAGSTAAEPTFDAQHVADAGLYMAALPLDANVQFLTITATKMPFIGRG